MSKTIKVKVDFLEEEVIIKKRGLLIWGEICNKFDGILTPIMEKAESMEVEGFIDALPGLISTYIVKVIDLLELATPLTRKELEEDIDPSEALELILAVIEVNGIFKVSEQVGKMRAMFKNLAQ